MNSNVIKWIAILSMGMTFVVGGVISSSNTVNENKKIGDSMWDSSEIVWNTEGPVKMPEKHMDRFAVVSDMAVGDVAWVCRLLIDSLENVWILKGEMIRRKKWSYYNVKIIRDKKGYLVDLRFCDGKQFAISGYTMDYYGKKGFPVYSIISK